MQYVHRYLEEHVLFMARHFKVVLVVGPRQVGKSTLLANLFPHLPIVTFSPVHDVQDARKDPEFFLSRFKGPVILDEVQYVPELLAYIKLRVDQSPEKGQYFLTGSQNLSLLKTASESMAGRVGTIELAPMVFYEQQRCFTLTKDGLRPRHWLEHYLENPHTLPEKSAGVISGPFVTEAIWRGGYPELLEAPERLFSEYFKNYIKTYVDRDIRVHAEVEDLMRFNDFVALLAAITAQEINYNQLGREIAASGKTAQRWLSILYATYMWRDARPFVGNTIKRITQKSKGYFVDTGFACQLLHIPSPESLMGHPMLGHLFETYVSNMLAVIIQRLSFSVGVYHWRSSGGAEVDILLECNNALYPIEVKIKSRLTGNDARGIKAFFETYKDGRYRLMPGIIVYTGTECYWVVENVLAVPWNMLCKD